MLLTALLPCALACLPAASGGVVVFRGTPGGAGDVVVVDPAGVQPLGTSPALTGITLIPIDCNGRTEFESLRPDRSRLRTDVVGASRVELAAGFGSLYGYSRPDASGVGVWHGLFVVDASGEARAVFELLGIGPALDQAPFVTRVAVAASGDRVLVATKTQAGGDLYEVDLVNATALNRTPTLAPQRFVAAGLHLAPTWGVAGTVAGVLRFDRANNDEAQFVPFGAAQPAWFSGQVVLSDNGLHAVTIAGQADDAAHVFAFDPSGDALQVTTAPAELSGAGFLPEALHGPYLAISDDGQHCAWRTEGLTAREAYLGRVPQPAPVPEVQVTADVNYLDTLDEIGWFMFRGVTQRLVMAVGEVSTTGLPVIENLDFYAVTPAAAGAPAILNLTQSNGLAQPPFLVTSSLKPSALYELPGTDVLLMHSEQSGGSGELVAASTAQAGATVLLTDVKALEFVERAGSRVLVDLQRSSGPKNRELYALGAPFTSVGAALMSVSGLTTFERTAARADGWLAFAQRLPTKELLWRYDPQANAVTKFSDRLFYFGPALAWAPSGELCFSIGAGGATSIFAAWPTNGPVFRLPAIGIGPGFVLPGA